MESRRRLVFRQGFIFSAFVLVAGCARACVCRKGYRRGSLVYFECNPGCSALEIGIIVRDGTEPIELSADRLTRGRKCRRSATLILCAGDLVGRLNCRYLKELDLKVANGELEKPKVWGTGPRAACGAGRAAGAGLYRAHQIGWTRVTVIDGVGVDRRVGGRDRRCYGPRRSDHCSRRSSGGQVDRTGPTFSAARNAEPFRRGRTK